MTDECLVNILRISERPDLLYSAQRIEALKAERGLELAEVARLEAEVKRLTKRVEVREVAKKGWTR